jgi:poly-gamma-glutamate synthesis protein (capsule biosynthesis protein)
MTTDELDEDIVLLACGDLLLADFYFNIGLGTGSLITKNGTSGIFDDVRPILDGGDLVVGNLECPISESSIHHGLHSREFLALPGLAKTLYQEGFRLLSVANNHISQHGVKAFDDTVNELELNGIDAVGVCKSDGNKQHLVCKNVKGKMLGFLAYSLVKDYFEKEPTSYAHGTYGIDIFDAVNRARKECDFLILMLHWGDEFIDRPSMKQVKFAHRLVDIGCDVILGGHSHVFQGVENYRGKVIAYSLGNFVFSMPWKRVRVSGILKVKLNNRGFIPFFVFPIWIDDYFKPIVPKGKIEKYVQGCLNSAMQNLRNANINNGEYERLVELGLKQYRKATWISFVQNLPKMPINITVQLLFEFLKRRLHNY